ncbi:3-dehydroquinate synthase [Selenihalanaerobacter shriftii]|uniref:3-dehydroquinate synthase n=1 Tax=Selenihalanaerobacter shriftii TaxID=142842 RepID=A0A1T4P341_9FIRM|nr:3-dehydroquinate synthase [Selenihalanaerobacter shriftii]SJZ85945.1 3-dehydroquinate synthase [Selenihalanaerobacter shriftii]
MELVGVDLEERSYEIKIGAGLLANLGQSLIDLDIKAGTKILIITDKRVNDLYGSEINQRLEETDFEFKIIVVPEGEKSKSLNMTKVLYDEAVDFGLDRSSLIIAFGGGVIGDLAGFIAATYMRGVPFIQIPTTLLAQVDSSVGGKTAVNHEAGKNLIGAFYQPELVLIDLEVLNTLDQRDVRSGLAEVIKYGVIWDKEFFNYLQANHKEIKELDLDVLAKVIQRSCQIKAEVVAKDEKELGLRAILNYGHTIGHAIEALAGYGEYRHGEAVAIGMISAMELAYKLDMVTKEEVEAQTELINNFGLPTTINKLRLDQIISKTKQDKKVKDGEVNFILPNSIGEVEIVSGVKNEVLTEVLAKQLR